MDVWERNGRAPWAAAIGRDQAIGTAREVDEVIQVAVDARLSVSKALVELSSKFACGYLMAVAVGNDPPEGIILELPHLDGEQGPLFDQVVFELPVTPARLFPIIALLGLVGPFDRCAPGIRRPVLFVYAQTVCPLVASCLNSGIFR